jgi:3-methylcrotonyl-CoA carboxylase beta subunit
LSPDDSPTVSADARSVGCAGSEKLQKRTPAGLYDVLPDDHRLPYKVEEVIDRILDADVTTDGVSTRLCSGNSMCPGRLNGRAHRDVIANRRGFLKTKTRSAHWRHCLYGIGAQSRLFCRERCSARDLPFLYLQDVSGFMVGVEAET